MENKLMRKGLGKKVLSSLLIIFFLIISISQGLADSNSLKETECCGFIVPLVKYKDAVLEDLVNCKIRNMINDFLREQISVYWIATNVTASIRSIEGEIEQDKFFERGTFIILFTGNNTLDVKIIAIACDYNQSNEAEENNTIKIPVYLLQEPLLQMQAYLLSEVKLAQYASLITAGEICYVEISNRCGFLTFELLNETEVGSKLNNKAFNVLTRVGDDQHEYSSFLKSYYYGILEDVKYNASNKIRTFVYNGGGYIGSCGGAEKACAGMMLGPVSIYFKRRAYNPNLSSYGLYAIADVIFIPWNNKTGRIPVEIVDDSHPVTFGLNRTVWDLHLGGPKFNHIGCNTHIIAKFSGQNNMSGFPSWLSSSFGSGRAVLFSTHPEISGYYNTNDSKDGRTIISNALFYTTSKGKKEMNTSQSRSLSFIITIWDKTDDLILGEPENVFNAMKTNINRTINETLNLSEYIRKLMVMAREIASEKGVNLSKDLKLFGRGSLSESRKEYLTHFIDYLNNTIETLITIEEIYPLLINNSEFQKSLEMLKTDLSIRINETRNICANSQEICMDYEKFLQNYQKYPWRSILWELLIMDTAHSLYREIFSGLHFVPQTYFNSLKFLRTSWYNYEVTVAI